jgi:hypothetical protein
MWIHDTWLTGCHEHAAGALTLNVAVPPLLAAEALVGERL